jgi:hypothetical protein
MLVASIFHLLPNGQLIFQLDLVGVRQALPAVQRLGDARGPQLQATVVNRPPQKLNLILRNQVISSFV